MQFLELRIDHVAIPKRDHVISRSVNVNSFISRRLLEIGTAFESVNSRRSDFVPRDRGGNSATFDRNSFFDVDCLHPTLIDQIGQIRHHLRLAQFESFPQLALDVADLNCRAFLAKPARSRIVALVEVSQNLLPDLVVWVQGAKG